MTYKSYLKFYNIIDTEENREAWIYNEWSKGRVYLYDNEFYSTETNEKVF